MRIRAIFSLQGILLLALVAAFLANVIYCAISVAGMNDGATATAWDLAESVGLSLLGVVMFIAFLSYSAVGWWAVVLIAIALCIYDIATVLVFEIGAWRYLYSFLAAVFYAAIIYSMLKKSFLDKISVRPHRVAVVPKLFFSTGIAFLFMFVVESELLSVFVGLLTLTLLSERVNLRRIERAKRRLSKGGTPSPGSE